MTGRIMGIDPGLMTGWALYSALERRVLAAGQFPEAEASIEFREHSRTASVFVLERPKGYGATHPAVVDAAFVAGQLVALTNAATLTRRDVKNILTEATQRDVIVTDKPSAWSALKLLHGGEGFDKKGGVFYGLRGLPHARDAVAVAVAFALKQAKAAEAV